MIGVVDSILCQISVVESMLRFRSVWEAESVRGVADFHVEGLKCDRGRRFYRGAAKAS